MKMFARKLSLLTGLADAPVQQLSEGVTFQMVSTTVMRGGEITKSKYQSEFEEYVKTLDPSRILLDTRRTSNPTTTTY
jgi:hypothetical protein